METPSAKSPAALVWQLIAPEKPFFTVAIIYSIAISLLTLSVPIAVQTLINSLVNIASTRTIVILAILLFFALIISGALTALRTRIMEYFERRIYARLTAEVSLHTIYARHDYFAGRRNTDITNRYFDIVILQKNVPVLLVDGLALFFQMLVGITLVSLYHPILLLFNLLLILTITLIWKAWGRGATKTAIQLSHAKYETSKWLNSLAYAHEFFKSARHIDYAIEQTDQLTHSYVTDHKSHFKYTFSQTISFLLLYAVASASLLGIGGFLVVEGQLSLGQLVAAELILAAILFGLSKSADYLKLYYQMCGAADEIGRVFSVPQEEEPSSSGHTITGNSLSFKNVHFDNYLFNFNIPEGAKTLVRTHNIKLEQVIIHLLKRNLHPASGSIELCHNDLEDFDLYHLRQEIMVIDRTPIIECTIKDYLLLSFSTASLSEIKAVLEKVDVLNEVESLPDGLDTLLSPLGNPLSQPGFLQIKLAAALLASPKVLVITQFFDHLPAATIKQVTASVRDTPITVLYFTKQEAHSDFAYYLTLDIKQQTLSQSSFSNLTHTPDH